MRSMRFLLMFAIAGQLAWALDARVRPFLDVGAESPAASIASNVEDLARFVAFQLGEGQQGGAVLKGSTLREMHRVQWLQPDWQSGWCLGFAIRRVGGQVRLGHGGSLPGHRTQIEFAPADKLGVVVMTNADDGDPVSYVDQAFKLLTPALKRAAEERKPAPIANPSWDKYTGTYVWANAEAQVMLLNGELVLITPEEENPWESRILLRPVAANTFRMDANSFSYEAVGELLTFETGPDGRVERMKTASTYWLRK